ncbi:MAG: GNAT family N-acetyltransferase [Beijerinckiaceae bacterium]
MISIAPGDLDDPRIVALLQFHFTQAHAVTPKGSAHALDVSGLKTPDISFWAAWHGDVLAGIGALKQLAPDAGEIKSMHTATAMRRSGVGSAMLAHIMATARDRDYARLYLETGSFDYFRPAAALYRKHGFKDCPPFAGYRPDPNSLFMMCDLTG